MSPSVVECFLSMHMVLGLITRKGSGEGVRRERGRRDEFATSASNWNFTGTSVCSLLWMGQTAAPGDHLLA